MRLGWLPAGTQRAEASGRVMRARVARGNEGQAAGSVHVSSLLSPMPFSCTSHLVFPAFLLVLYVTLYARRAANAWSIFKFPLNTYSVSWIFPEEVRFGGIFILVLLNRKQKGKEIPLQPSECSYQDKWLIFLKH